VGDAIMLRGAVLLALEGDRVDRPVLAAS
jgi:hypothetical protein